MLTCRKIDELTIDIVDKTLTAVQKIHVSFHLLMCKNCRIHVKKTQVLVNSLAKLAQESEPPKELLQRLDDNHS